MFSTFCLSQSNYIDALVFGESERMEIESEKFVTDPKRSNLEYDVIARDHAVTLDIRNQKKIRLTSKKTGAFSNGP